MGRRSVMRCSGAMNAPLATRRSSRNFSVALAGCSASCQRRAGSHASGQMQPLMQPGSFRRGMHSRCASVAPPSPRSGIRRARSRRRIARNFSAQARGGSTHARCPPRCSLEPISARFSPALQPISA
jgi:hypothetical protein